MPKKRVYELAKQFGINSKDIIELLEVWNVDIKTHMASVDNNLQDRLENHYNKDKTINKKIVKKESDVKTDNLDNKEILEKKDLEVKKDETQTTTLNQQNTTENKPNNNQNKKYNNQGYRNNNNNNQRPNNNQTQNQRPYNKPNNNQTQRTNNTQPNNQRPNNNQTQNNNQRSNDNQRSGYTQRPNNYQGQNNRPNNQNNNSNTGYNQRPNNNGPRQYNNQNNNQRPNNNQNSGQTQNYNNNNYKPRPNNGFNKPKTEGSSNQGARPNNQNKKLGFQNKDKKVFNKDAFNKDEPQQARKPFSKPKKDGLIIQEKPTERKDKFLEKKEKTFDKNELLDKKEKPLERKKVLKEKTEDADAVKFIKISSNITVKNLAEKMNKQISMVIKSLMKQSIMATINQEIDFETASKVAEEYGFLLEEQKEEDAEDILRRVFETEAEASDDKDLCERPPVVVVMGHVDHGKTSLLDSLRKSSVVANEAGGITQHIGAYMVSINGKPITFLDTPGHEAFTAMRMRGAKVTDIAILVVAADDGVMPQTVEAINHAKAAGIDIIVAINKIDKPSANPDRVKQELVEYGLVSEDWGGETICVPVSALNNIGIDTLLEMITIVSEMKELKANPNKKAKGTVIEALLDKGKGPVATVLVQEGTIRIGDPIIAGDKFGKIRAMTDDKGRKVKKAGPSMPVEILGLSEVPSAGDLFYVANNEKQARHVADTIKDKGRVDMLKDSVQKVSLDDLFDQIKQGSLKDLNLVIKADVQGSVEAVRTSLEKLSTDEVRIKTIHGGVGGITESDVMLAAASGAIIIGFNVRPEPKAKAMADENSVDLRLYRVIYSAIEDINLAIKGMLDPIFEEQVLGHAEVRQLFKVSNLGTIAGSYILDGKITRNSKVRVLRDNVVVYEGTLSTLKRFKDDVKEVLTGYECGLLFDKFNDVREGDTVEAYIMKEVKR